MMPYPKFKKQEIVKTANFFAIEHHKTFGSQHISIAAISS